MIRLAAISIALLAVAAPAFAAEILIKDAKSQPESLAHALANVEKTFAVPGVTFAEWGPGDMAMSLNGLAFYPDPPVPRATEFSVPSSIAPNVAQARLKVAAAAAASGVRLLDTCIPETVVDSIKLGGMVLECSEQSALIGREYTKRRMPV
jgi:hypothetical protein